MEGIVLPEGVEYAKHVYHLFVIKVNGERGTGKGSVEKEG